ncbi:hypothetical protein [Streptomyces sp. NPDC057199]|uniref:hypothetical protein n=1 Tax=Streptomyces sp. NPDC057199 TaxID=3346047 RepID=UPI00363CE6EF
MTTIDRETQLASFCSELPVLSRAVDGTALAAVLEDVKRRIEAGADVAAELTRLGIPSASPSREPGYSGALGRRRTWSAAPEYVCPAGLCHRAEHREPGGPMPQCALTSAPLRPGP